MVIKGKPRGGGSQLAAYLLKKGDNDNVRVFDIRGTSQPNDLRKSLIEMSLTSELTKSDKGLYHSQINPRIGEDKTMSYADWLLAADILESELKLNNQKRVIVLHEKAGRTHAHVVWERYDHEKGIMKSDSHSRLAQDRARKTMEQVLEQQKTPDRNLNRPVMKKVLTELWQQSKSASHFIRNALANGYMITKGRERRSFIVVDNTGRSFDLVRQLDVKTKEVRELLQHEKLITDKMAIKIVRSRDSMNDKQHGFVKAISEYKLSHEKKKAQKDVFSSKLAEMKSMAGEAVNDSTDKNINSSQSRSEAMLKFYKDKISDDLISKQEIKKKFREQFQKEDKKNNQNGLEL